MKTNCIASKHNLILESSGEVKLCCNSNMSLDYQPGMVETAIVGKLATEIQSALDTGILHNNCTKCWNEQQHNGRSYRQSYNNMYPKYNKLTNRSIKTMHIQYENTCNLTCVYCGPEFSSKWADLRGMRQGFRNPVVFSDAALTSLGMITLAGGEPSLIKTNIELLDRLYKVNPNCQVIINTNLSSVQSNAVFERLVKFKNATVIVSFEAVEKQYEYIRKGANWLDFCANIKWVCDRVENVQSSMILFPLSIKSICNAIDFSLEFIAPGDIFINNYFGSQLTWGSVDQQILDNLTDKLLLYDNAQDTAIKEQIISMSKDIKSDRIGTHLPLLDDLDQSFGTNHKNIFTELYN